MLYFFFRQSHLKILCYTFFIGSTIKKFISLPIFQGRNYQIIGTLSFSDEVVCFKLSNKGRIQFHYLFI